jgi:large subunit ribosomal protein L4
MATVDVRDVAGKVLSTRELPADLFEAPINVPVMHQVVVAGLAAQRAGTHSTKTRGDVAGGGKKPWRQKGTGRARQGSIRAPQWVGGGVVHGPHPRSYEMRVNKKMKRVSLRSALSDTLASGKLAVVDELAFDGPKTKDAVAVLDALELQGKILVVIPTPDDLVHKSFRNLANVRIAYPGNLSTYDLIGADRVLFTAAALDVLSGQEPPARTVAGESTEEPDVGEATEQPGSDQEDEEVEP